MRPKTKVILSNERKSGLISAAVGVNEEEFDRLSVSDMDLSKYEEVTPPISQPKLFYDENYQIHNTRYEDVTVVD